MKWKQGITGVKLKNNIIYVESETIFNNYIWERGIEGKILQWSKWTEKQMEKSAVNFEGTKWGKERIHAFKGKSWKKENSKQFSLIFAV